MAKAVVSSPNSANWWTVTEFAALTHRTEAAVRASIARGDLPAVRIGRRWFIDPAYFAQEFEKAATVVREKKAQGA